MIPRGSFKMPGKCTAPETRPSSGVCPVGSPEAAAAIERVRRALNGNQPRQVFTIVGKTVGTHRFVLDCASCGTVPVRSPSQVYCPTCGARSLGAYQEARS